MLGLMDGPWLSDRQAEAGDCHLIEKHLRQSAAALRRAEEVFEKLEPVGAKH